MVKRLNKQLVAYRIGRAKPQAEHDAYLVAQRVLPGRTYGPMLDKYIKIFHFGTASQIAAIDGLHVAHSTLLKRSEPWFVSSIILDNVTTKFVSKRQSFWYTQIPKGPFKVYPLRYSMEAHNLRIMTLRYVYKILDSLDTWMTGRNLKISPVINAVHRMFRYHAYEEPQSLSVLNLLSTQLRHLRC